MSATRVAVIGAGGRMGATVCAALEAADDLELVGRYDVGDALDDLAGADVAVDFTVPDASPGNVAHCVDRGVHVVVGTTGWTDERLDTLRDQLGPEPAVGVLVAPNFAIGAVLSMAFARRAAPFFESVEVVELHHPDKVDAPSGTAARTAELVGAAREPVSAPCPTRRPTTPAVPAAPASTASRCTRCGCGGSSPTRRCSSAARARC
jgi:4-hydroxy-tetrahydrodipicolinate reductase